MKKSIINSLMLTCLVFSGATATRGQSAYFQAITNLNPAGYWPMHETGPGAQGDIETNYGTLGALASAYYTDWGAANTGVTRGTNSALGGNPDPSVAFTAGTGSYLLVPRTSPLTTLQAPFSIEAWVQPTTQGFGDLVGEGGQAFNGGGAGNVNGVRLSYGPSFQIYAGKGTGGWDKEVVSGSYAVGQWYHVVATYDGTNFWLYVNNTSVGHAAYTMQPDVSSPLTIGNAFWGTGGPQRAVHALMDEVAIYTNVLSGSDISTHYNDGLSGGAGVYKADVLANFPVIYLRMDAPAYSAPALASWPALVNSGTVAANGVYTPGTLPGGLTGMSSNGFPTGLSGAAVAPLNGMGSFVDAGSAPDYNPSGATATFSVSAMFQGNPTDARNQSICSHGTNSWQLILNTSGKLVFNAGTGQAAGNAVGDLVSTKVYNDGYWHQVVATHNGTANALYVDGVLDATGTSSLSIPGATRDVLIGSDACYTNSPAAIGRQFAGRVCEVAFFPTQLQLGDVQGLFSAAGVIPFITQQPISATVNAGVNFTNPVAVIGSVPLAYRWYQDNAPMPGQTNASLVLNPVAGSNNSANLFLVVTNVNGAVTSSVVSLTVNTGPIITNQAPVPYTNLFTLFAGVNPTFSVGVAGAAPLHYQWYTNGAPVAQATNASLSLANLQIGFLTNYCIITNSLGSATSFVWSASVVAQPAAPYPQAVLGLSPLAYWRLNEADDSLSDGNPGAIAHDYVGGKDGIYTNTWLGQTGYSQGLANQYGYSPASDPGVSSSQFGYFSANNSDANSIAGIDFSAASGSNAAFTVEAWVNGLGQSVANAGIASKGYFNNEQFDLDAGAANKCYRFELRGANGTAYNANSTVSAGDNRWHHLVGVCDQPNGALNLYIDGVLAGSASLPAGSGILSANASVPMIIGARPTDATTGANNQFYGYINDVALYTYALSYSQVDAQYNAAGVPPYFTQPPPASATVNENDTLTLVAAVNGTAPITLQWWDATLGQPFAGQTNTTLVIINVPGTLDGHQVYLQAANAYGAPVNSSQVTLTIVTGPPTITLDLPTPIITAAGKPYTYSVAVGGPQPYHYQWYYNGSPVSGQTSSSYTFSAASGLYKVVITNLDGPSTSTVSTLTAVTAPSYPYSSATLGLYGAVGYWPLQETTPPAPANIETNHGTLGALGNAYYAGTNATNVSFGQTGALANDPDTSVTFSGINGTTPTSFAFIPRLSPSLTLQPPFTWEVWVKPVNTAFGDLFAYGGGSGLNGGNWAGFRLSWGGNFQIYGDDGTSSTSFTASFTSPSYAAGQWHYCAVTYDGTTANVYVDGSASPVATGLITMATDTWTPLTIGAGRWQGVPTRGFNGVEDEVAVYTNVLSVSDMTTHYKDGLSGASGAYVTDVQSGHPLLYYRMDIPIFTNPSPLLFPSALNFGTAPVNGAYQPGIVPGGITGPVLWGLGTNLRAAPINGVVSCVDAGNDPSFNPTGTQPFSAATWFRAYPSDSRLQTVMSHGTNWALNLDGSTGLLVWNVNTAGSLASAGIVNDGNWHFAVGAYDGTHNLLYIDGVLQASGNAAGALASDTAANLFLGGDARSTAAGSQGFFGGALAHAAFFTNALTAAQVSELYNLATGTPAISSLVRSGSQLVITYSGTLVSSTNVAGPYSNVAGASPPTYTTAPSQARMFYRAKQ